MAATGTLTWRERATRAGALALAGASTEALVLAAAIPLLFIHARYQPTIHVALASTTVGIQLSDFAVLAVVLAALAAGLRRGFAPLRPGLVLWASVALYFVWIGIEILIPGGSAGYPTAKHTVTAAKFLEYALLAPSVVLIVRRRVEIRLLVVVLTAWSVLASAVGLVQFFGANIFVSGATGGRQLSFLGFHDFATLSAAALLAGAAAVALPRLELDGRIGPIGLVSGAIGVVLSAALAAVIGVCAAAAALLALAVMRRELHMRRLLVTGAIVGIAVLGALTMRSTALGRYLGLKHEPAQQVGVESYFQRGMLAWIGWEMFRDHPVAGVGWEASSDPSRFLHYIPAAKRRYPKQLPIAFPSPRHPWGVQNFYVQHLADLGVVGILLLAAVFLSGIGLALRRIRARPASAVLALVWILVVGGVWIAQGIVAGLPLDGLMWLSFGLAAGV